MLFRAHEHYGNYVFSDNFMAKCQYGQKFALFRLFLSILLKYMCLSLRLIGFKAKYICNKSFEFGLIWFNLEIIVKFGI